MGLVGTGAMGYAHLPAYLKFSEEVKLTSICDINEKSAKLYGQRAKIETIYTDLEKMLKEEDLDAVDICTIHDQHKKQIIMAAEAGKHILLEKPMACKLQDCKDMVRATEKADIVFMLAQVLRYLPSSQAVLKILQKKELGSIQVVRGDSILKQSMILPHDHWMFDGNRAGGGVLITLSIHIIDLLRYFLGNVKKVSGLCITTDPLFINGAEDIASANLEFVSGAIGNIFGSLSIGRTPWNIKYMIFGNSGTIYSNPPSPKTSHYQLGNSVLSSKIIDKEEKTSQKGDFIPIDPDYESLVGDDPFINEVIHFIDCCKNDKVPISNGKDNLDTMKIIFGIYKSSKTNKTIHLNDL
ncbi:MAG: Gfo/Idh/MocA family protein [Candidatus Thorarchaeota archaeon]